MEDFCACGQLDRYYKPLINKKKKRKEKRLLNLVETV
jgi:hypothetical protein